MPQSSPSQTIATIAGGSNGKKMACDLVSNLWANAMKNWPVAQHCGVV